MEAAAVGGLFHFYSNVNVANVQVFGRRDDDTLDGLRRPAAEKRQGTKSR
jgi:hypothetical protein